MIDAASKPKLVRLDNPQNHQAQRRSLAAQYAKLNMKHEEPKIFGDLYPHLTDGEVSEARDRVDRYIQLATKIFERLRCERGDAGHIPLLTDEPRCHTLDGERSKHEENKKQE